MNNGPGDAASLHRGRGPAPTDTNATTGVSINIESDNDGDDNESTSAEHDYLLPAPMPTPPVASTQPIVAPSTSTSINMEHVNQPARSSSLTGARPAGGNLLSSLLARQRSFTPVNTSPVRVTTQMNRRLQQSRSVGANSTTMEDPPPAPAAVTSPASMRQLGFWRVNLNDVLSLSTAPSTEALRSFINHSHSNFRHYPPATIPSVAGNAAPPAAAAAQMTSGANATGTDNTHILLNQQQLPPNETEAALASSSATRSPRMGAFQNNNGGMGRSISLREGEMQRQARHSLNGRHNASVIGLTTPAVATAANNNPPAYETTTHSEGAPDGVGAPGVLPGLPPGIVPPQPLDINADDDQLITETVVQILSHFVRYVPILCILLIKFVHDHLVGILDLLLLQTIMYTLNRSVRHQVSRLAQKNYAVLFRDACVIIVVVSLRLFMASMPPDPLGLLVPPPKIYQTVDVSTSHYKTDADLNNVLFDSPPTTFHSSYETLKESNETVVPKVIPLGMLLYYVAVSDLLLKLLTILAKIGVTLLPLHMIRLKVRARLYVLVEYTAQFYRALVPMSQWFMFLYESYSGLEVISGGLFSSLYIGAKIFELIERGKSLKKSITTFRRNIDAERPPTKDELDAASSVCPICHDTYNSPILLECGHIFCDECVQTWFKREQTCPMCRAKVSDDPAWQDGSTTFFHQLY